MSSFFEADLIAAKALIVEERIAPARITASDHERLIAILRAELHDAGTVLPMREVLSFLCGDRGVEVHAQIHPHGSGTKIRLVQRGTDTSPKLFAALTALMVVVGAATALQHESSAARLALWTAGPGLLVALIWGYAVWTRRRQARRLKRAADALSLALATSLPNVRVNAELESEEAGAPAEGQARSRTIAIP